MRVDIDPNTTDTGRCLSINGLNSLDADIAKGPRGVRVTVSSDREDAAVLMAMDASLNRTNTGRESWLQEATVALLFGDGPGADREAARGVIDSARKGRDAFPSEEGQQRPPAWLPSRSPDCPGPRWRKRPPGAARFPGPWESWPATIGSRSRLQRRLELAPVDMTPGRFRDRVDRGLEPASQR